MSVLYVLNTILKVGVLREYMYFLNPVFKEFIMWWIVDIEDKRQRRNTIVEGFAILKLVAEYPQYICENYLPFLSSNVACNPFSLSSSRNSLACSWKDFPKKAIIKLTYSTEFLTHITKVYMPVGNQEWPLYLNQF